MTRWLARHGILAAGLVAALLMARPASAHFPCFQPALRDGLRDNHGEAPMLAGATLDGNLFELWARADGATFTAVMVLGDGRVCPLVAGEGLAPAPPPAPGPSY